MKILLSSYQCLPDAGSELGNGWQWARALADYGHDVTVLTQPSHIIRAAAPPDIEFLHVDAAESPLRRFSGYLGTLGDQLRWGGHYLRWQDAAFRHVASLGQHYDVVHHVSWGSLRFGSMLWQLPVPLVYGPIGGGQTAPGRYWRYFGRGWPVEMLRMASAGSMLTLNSRSRQTIRNAAVTLATNSATAAACQRLGGADVRYMLAEGVPGDWVVGARRRPPGIPVVLWVGGLLPHKAPALALRAFAQLRRAMPARLVVAGDGPLLGQVRTMVERLGLTDDVRLLGRVPWHDIRYLYDSASVLLFASLRDSSGSQFLEGLSRGLPAVALDHHGIADMDAGPAALKVSLTDDPADLPGRLASALEIILRDSEWDMRSEACVSWAAGHVWPAKAAVATQIYQEMAASSPSGRHRGQARAGRDIPAAWKAAEDREWG